MQPFIEAALGACQEVDALIRANSDDEAYALYEAGAGGDLSSGFDLMAEAVFIRRLGAFGTISSEECGVVGEGEDLIILDPIDGSDNLKSRFPYYGASIALQKQGKTVASLVCNFANAECFVRSGDLHYKTSLSDTFLREAVTPNPHAAIGLFEKAYFNPEHVATLKKAGLKFRSPGAVALSLAYAHYVKYVLFFGTMRPYDLEAGLYLCEDLHLYQDEEMLIVSKEASVFDEICTIFNVSRESL